MGPRQKTHYSAKRIWKTGSETINPPPPRTVPNRYNQYFRVILYNEFGYFFSPLSRWASLQTRRHTPLIYAMGGGAEASFRDWQGEKPHKLGRRPLACIQPTFFAELCAIPKPQYIYGNSWLKLKHVASFSLNKKPDKVCFFFIYNPSNRA